MERKCVQDDRSDEEDALDDESATNSMPFTQAPVESPSPNFEASVSSTGQYSRTPTVAKTKPPTSNKENGEYRNVGLSGSSFSNAVNPGCDLPSAKCRIKDFTTSTKNELAQSDCTQCPPEETSTMASEVGGVSDEWEPREGDNLDVDPLTQESPTKNANQSCTDENSAQGDIKYINPTKAALKDSFSEIIVTEREEFPVSTDSFDDNIVDQAESHVEEYQDDEDEGSRSDSSNSSEDASTHIKDRDPLAASDSATCIGRREANIARNNKRLEELGLAKPSKKRSQIGKKRKSDDSVETEDGDIEQIGMLIDSIPHDHNHDLVTKYPGREPQIRLLRATLNATIAQLDQDNGVYVPPPIFIFGPCGVGKTSLTRDVVKEVLSPRIGFAYINCATLEPSSIESLVNSAYRQIAGNFNKKDKRGKRKGKRRRKRSMSTLLVMTRNIDENESKDADMEDQVEDARMQSIQLDEESELDGVDIGNELENARMQSTRVCNKMQMKKSRLVSDVKSVKSVTRVRYSRQSKIEVEESEPRKRLATGEKKDEATSASSYASHGAPLALGRALKSFIGKDGKGCAFLVLDNAERLMSLSINGRISRSKSNYLAQLLLLPKVMELNLSVIIISRSSLLMNSRIDNSSPVERSIGTLCIGVHPIRIHFSAYSGNESFKAILKTPYNVSIMIGNGYNSDFHQALISAFLNALVQAMTGMTRDVKDMLCAGRRLWRAYIEPLKPENIRDTLNRLGENGDDKQDALLSYLNQRMVAISRNYESYLLSFGSNDATDSTSELPYLLKCLLLASFICQHNKADKDKQLFTSSANGRRRGKRNQDDGDPETVAYATWEHQRLVNLRPRSFPLERMLSIFVSIVGLHESQELVITTGTTQSFLYSLGNSVFLENLGQLRLLGLLREVMSDDGIPLSCAIYCCDLGREDAETLAKSIHFPLDKYLL